MKGKHLLLVQIYVDDILFWLLMNFFVKNFQRANEEGIWDEHDGGTAFILWTSN